MIRILKEHARLARKRLSKPDFAEYYLVLKKCRVSVMSCAAVVAIFLFVPQAQDVLRSLAQPDALCRFASFEFLMVV